MNAYELAARRDPWEALVGADTADDGWLTAELVPGGVSARPAIVVIGATGGAGSTLVACGLALAHAQLGQPVALAEFASTGGDLAATWEVPPDRTLDDLAAVVDELGPHHVDMVCHPHGSGVNLLLASRSDMPNVWDGPATALLLSCAASLGAVVVDAGTAVGPHVDAACLAADVIVVVATPTLRAARRTNLITARLDRLGARGSVTVALNRGLGRDHLSTGAFASAAGSPVILELPSSTREADGLGAGLWITRRRGGLAQTLAGLVAQLGSA